MIFELLKDRLNPPEPITVFVRDKTTPKFKYQVLNIVREYYYPRYGYDYFSISTHSDDIVHAYSVAKSIEPLKPGERYPDTTTFDWLNQLDD